MEYQMSKGIAHQIAVGLYRNIGTLIFDVKQDNPADYERFKEDYIAKLAAQTATPAKRRYIRKQQHIQR